MPAVPIDEAELQARVEAVLGEAVPGAAAAPLSPLQGGASSITYWTTVTTPGKKAQKVVLKVAPAGLEPTKNRDVLRQARLQLALEGSGVPVPRVIAQHPGSPPEIPPFFAMSFESGDCLEPNSLPPGTIPAPEVRDREVHAARILGTLHRTDPAAAGLGDEPAKTLQEEVQHWIRGFAACDEDLRAGTDDVAERLLATVPPLGTTTLIHGDYRLGNTLSEGNRVVSVIDWEIWARSDARVDLAWFLMMANPDASMGRTVAEGMPPEAELLGAYEDARGTPVEGMEWFAALVRYKQAAAGALLTRNARRRGQESTTSAGNPGLLASARQLLGIG